MLVDDALANRQPQARAVFLRREKRLEQPRQIFRRDARRRCRGFEFSAAVAPSCHRRFRADSQFAARPHRLDRVEQQVHERLLQLRLVAAHRVGFGAVIALSAISCPFIWCSSSRSEWSSSS